MGHAGRHATGCIGREARLTLQVAVSRDRNGDHILRTAAALATIGPGAVASHQTAASIHYLDLLDTPQTDVTLTRTPGHNRSGRAGVHIYCAELPKDHVTEAYGMPVTTPARTVLDLPRSLEFRVVFRDCGLPPPDLQIWAGGAEVVGRVDFLWRRYRTVAEVDGRMKYANSVRAVRQLERDRQLRDAGYEVVHFTWKHITENAGYVNAAIREAFRRGAQPTLPAVG